MCFNVVLTHAYIHTNRKQDDIDGLAQDCSNSIANALELLKSHTKPSVYKGVQNSHLSS